MRRGARRALVAAGVGLAAAAAWILWPRGPLPDDRFLRHKGALEAAAVLAGEARDGAIFEDLELRSTSGLVARARLRRPASSPDPPVPACVLMGGLRTGRRAVDHVPDDAPPMVWIALDYLAPEMARRAGAFDYLRRLPEFQRGVERTVAAMLLAVDLLHADAGVDTARILVAGGSLGAYFAVVAGGIDPRTDAVALLHGGAPLAAVVTRNLPWKSGTLRAAGAALLNPWLGPLDPRGFAPRVSPRPLILINGRDDDRIPVSRAQALFDAAGEPRRLVVLDMGHEVMGEPETVARMTGEVMKALAAEGWFGGK